MNEKQNINSESHKIPNDIHQGISFVFDIGEKKITAWGFLFSGKECIYINDVLVSEKKIFRTKSNHEINVNGNKLRITFAIKIISGKVQCTLFENDIPIKKVESKLNIVSYFINVVISLFVLTVSGFIINKLRLPSWIIFFVGAFCIFLLLKSSPKNYKVTEVST
jgi:hypothetical protein